MHDDFDPRPDNHEAAMARADLYKLAAYSMKLFKMIQEGDELEGWVQAKITKAADYIASVYHFMEYEMKASQYGNHLENAEMYSESVRRAFAQKLVEAKKMAAKAKEVAKKDEDDEEIKEATKSKKGDGNLANNAKPYDKVTRGDVIAGRLGKDEKGGKEEKVEEGSATARKKWVDINSPEAKKSREEQKAKMAKEKAAEPGKKLLKKIDQKTTESTGDYSAKKARAGKDIGEPGKNFAKIAKKAGEKYGSKERGEKVAGAVLAKLRKG